MAEKKEHNIIEVESDKPAKKKTSTSAKKKTTEDGRTVIEVTESGSAVGYRIGAIVLWVVAIACEIIGLLLLFGKINVTKISTLTLILILLGVDLVCVIIGSQLWKKSNKIDPASKKNKVKFWLWNNLGLIVAIFAFLPFIIMIAKDNKTLDKKSKIIALVAACLALVVGGLCSIDYNPISSDEKDAAVSAITGDVYWSQFGKVYHIDEDCHTLNNSDELYHGSVETAIEKGRTRVCSYCAKRHEINTAGMLTDGNEDAAKDEPVATPSSGEEQDDNAA